jgi:uncharacterized protein YaaW (UPF0174 family)
LKQKQEKSLQRKLVAQKIEESKKTLLKHYLTTWSALRLESRQLSNSFPDLQIK